eukprot:1539118-Rhodomonas_salina.2
MAQNKRSGIHAPPPPPPSASMLAKLSAKLSEPEVVRFGRYEACGQAFGARSRALRVTSPGAFYTHPEIKTQEPAFSVRFVPRMRFLVLMSGRMPCPV